MSSAAPAVTPVETAIRVHHLVHRYGDRTALAGSELEVARGESAGRPRVKFTDVAETLAQLDR